MKATGTFSVDLKPLDGFTHGVGGNNLARMSIEKVFQGELDAISTGEMLSASTAVKGSAAYVAIEQVVGSLNGKSGSFILQHFASMQGDKQQSNVVVVPDSGTGQLNGLSGSMKILIKAGQHHYQFEYAL